MKLNLHNQAGERVGAIDLPDRIFNVSIDSDLLHRALVIQAANARMPLAHTKTRGEVRGGGIKPWRQKGTGRARHGSRRSPLWIGGGVTFGARKERNFSKKINKKEKQKALFMGLSSKVRDKELAVLETFQIPEVKTKEAARIFDVLLPKIFQKSEEKTNNNSVLLVMHNRDQNVERSVRNLSNLTAIDMRNLNVRDVLKYHYILMLKEGIKILDQHYNA